MVYLAIIRWVFNHKTKTVKARVEFLIDGRLVKISKLVSEDTANNKAKEWEAQNSFKREDHFQINVMKDGKCINVITRAGWLKAARIRSPEAGHPEFKSKEEAQKLIDALIKIEGSNPEIAFDIVTLQY